MASRSLNKAILIGNLTRDPELRYTPSGTAVCTFGLATNRSWTPTDGGERQEETEFHRIVAWHKLAELCAQLLFKGRKAYLEGRLQTRTWTGQDGQERTTTEVVIDNMIVLDSKRRPGEEVGEPGMAVGAPAPVTPAVSVAPRTPPGARLATGGKTKKSTTVRVTDDKKTAVVKEKKEETKTEDVKAEDIPF